MDRRHVSDRCLSKNIFSSAKRTGGTSKTGLELSEYSYRMKVEEIDFVFTPPYVKQKLINAFKEGMMD